MKISGGDFFCGAGGFTEGARQAIVAKGGEMTDWLAINHWPRAVASHSANHPKARHLCIRLDQVRPEDAAPRGWMDILLASPECTGHSNARGGKPTNDQTRAGAWSIIEWVNKIHIETILIENVREFRKWGPLNKRGKPIKRLAGQTYQAFLNALRAAGYTVEDRLINCADYGDPTTRTRLFIQCQRTRPICWPEPSHAGQWRAAREIIDWSLKGQSIFSRKKPLSEKTLARIEAGLVKFGLGAFVAEWDQQGGWGRAAQSGIRSEGQPLSTVSTKARHGLVEPFVVRFQGDHKNRDNSKRLVQSTKKPLSTVTSENRFGIAEPYLISLRGTSPEQLKMTATSIDKPLPTVSTGGIHAGVVSPYLVQTAHGNDDRTGNERRAKSVDKPLATVRGAKEWAIAEPFLVQTAHTGKRRARSLKEPMPTVAGNRGDCAVVEPMILGQQSCSAARSVKKPLPTVATDGAIALVSPFLTPYYGSSKSSDIKEPLPTVTGRDRFGLTMPVVKIGRKKYLVDILFRMLQPHELAGAQGFPKEYQFTGNKSEVVKQIGNAVPVNTASALVTAALFGNRKKARAAE